MGDTENKSAITLWCDHIISGGDSTQSAGIIDWPKSLFRFL